MIDFCHKISIPYVTCKREGLSFLRCFTECYVPLSQAFSINFRISETGFDP